jgi:hypothetical protein
METAMHGGWDPDTRMMKFLYGTTLCGVSGEALEDLAGVTGLDRAGLQGAFQQFEPAIRLKAAQKIDAGEFQENGTVRIVTADFA